MKKLILLALCVCALAAAQTTITDTLYTPITGQLFSGTLTINAPDMVSGGEILDAKLGKDPEDIRETIIKYTLARDLHPELVGVGPVSLDALTRHMNLGEEHFLGRAMPSAPVIHPALERA